MKSHYYSQHAGALRAELGEAVSRDEMRELHRKQPLRHLAVAARQFAILAAATWGLIHFENPLVWIPLALVQGFTVFNFTILLHEVVHHTVFERRHAGGGAVPRVALRRSPAASRPASSRGGTSITTRSSARTRTIPSGITCRRR